MHRPGIRERRSCPLAMSVDAWGRTGPSPCFVQHAVRVGVRVGLGLRSRRRSARAAGRRAPFPGAQRLVLVRVRVRIRRVLSPRGFAGTYIGCTAGHCRGSRGVSQVDDGEEVVRAGVAPRRAGCSPCSRQRVAITDPWCISSWTMVPARVYADTAIAGTRAPSRSNANPISPVGASASGGVAAGGGDVVVGAAVLVERDEQQRVEGVRPVGRRAAPDGVVDVRHERLARPHVRHRRVERPASPFDLAAAEHPERGVEVVVVVDQPRLDEGVRGQGAVLRRPRRTPT